MKDLNLYGWIAIVLLIIGGLNLGIYGIFGADVIMGIFGHLLGRLIFIVIGVAAIYKCYVIYLEKFKK